MIGPPQKRFSRIPRRHHVARGHGLDEHSTVEGSRHPNPRDEVGLVDVLWWPLGVLAQFPVSESMRVPRRESGPSAELAQHVLEAALPADRCLGHWHAQRDSLERKHLGDALLEQVTAIPPP